MTIRHLKLPLALAFALTASHAHALGLGQLQVKSGLGQPLVAEIPVLSATQAELDNFNVRLASPEAFARVGLDLPLSLSANLQMTLVKDARGLPVIRVTTPGRFNEPFLSFLVEADWGRGSLVREFTALVDPPFIAPAVIRPLQAPTVSVAVAPPVSMRPISTPSAQNPATIVQREPVAPAPVATPEPAPAITAAPPPPPMPYAPPPEPVAVAPEPAVEFEPSPFSQPLPELAAEPPAPPPPAPAAPAPIRQQGPAPKPVAAAPPPVPAPTPPAPTPVTKPMAMAPPPPAPVSDQYGPVKDGQTLWSLAESLRQDTSITVNQMMLAMQRANPGAFIDDNVNRLKSGAVLRIPAREESIAILPEEAAALIRQQSGMRPVPQPEQSVTRQPAPEPAAAATLPPAPAVMAPAKPAVAATRPRQGRLEIVPPAGKSGARSSQSGASASGGGTELRAELSQTKEDLAAREAEVVELKSRVSDLEKLQTDSKSLIEMQSSELKALRDRLAEIEKDRQTAASAPAAAPAAVAQTTAPANESAGSAATTTNVTAPEAATPWYQHPGTIGGAILFLSFIVWWLSRRGKGSETPAPTRRVSDDSALQASLARTSAASDEPEGPDSAGTASDDEDFEKLGLEDMVNMNPRDLEAHLNLLRYLHRKGDAAAFEAAATDMRGQLGNTTDPRWREVVVMGMGLLPGHPLFSQLGWNAPKFASSEPEPKVATPAPTAAAPPVPEPAEAPPSWMRTTAPSQIPGNRPDESAAFADGGNHAGDENGDPDEMDLSPFEHGSSPADIHRQEAELQDADETSATKIELARAYLDIGDIEGARAMLEDVLAEGGPEARTMAANILKELG